LTSPPLISWLGAWLARLRRSRFFYWVMDFNPDEAIAAGWLRPGSVTTRVLDGMSRFSLKQAAKIIALDRFMRDRIVAKGIAPEKVVIIPPWSHGSEVQFDPQGRKRFRQAHGLDGKFVVMYSGNHSPCHPLGTLLEAARRLEKERDIVFCFVGGGSEWAKVKQLAEKLSNVLCLPYQPLSALAGSLSAADLHVVVMGERFVGIVHPCKIYNILEVGAPVLYLGPCPSHVTEIREAMGDSDRFGCAAPGEVQQVLDQIHHLWGVSRSRPRERFEGLCATYSKEALLPRLLAILEDRAAAPSVNAEIRRDEPE